MSLRAAGQRADRAVAPGGVTGGRSVLEYFTIMGQLGTSNRAMARTSMRSIPQGAKRVGVSQRPLCGEAAHSRGPVNTQTARATPQLLQC